MKDNIRPSIFHLMPISQRFSDNNKQCSSQASLSFFFPSQCQRPQHPSPTFPPRGLAIREAEDVGLTKRSVNCATVNVGTFVNCRLNATSASKSITTFNEGTVHTFSCYTKGPCIGNNWYAI